MHRLPLLDMLRRYSSRYPDEAEMLARIRHLVESAPDCFQRTCRPGHITGSAWVLSHDRTKCLLLHHRKLDRWLQPGGHADGQTEIQQVALREAEEESGLTQLALLGDCQDLVPLDIDVHKIPARFDAAGNMTEDAHEHHDIRFLVVAGANQELVLSEESHDLRWFTNQEVLQVTQEESVLRMMRKAGPHKNG
ncbi:MAG TPA: NUDIX hydrolase [Planctomycetaceae bacterium]|nr:NUDIX hydrolase [Planctomycetaceae bacterium]